MSLLHLAWASAVTCGKHVELLPVCRSAKLSLDQNSYALPTLYSCQDDLYARISFTSPAPAPFPSFFLFSPPSILLTTCPASAEIECELSHFCHQDKGLWLCASCVSRWRPLPVSCGVFKLARPPISSNSHSAAALKWGPSAKCLCVSLPNPHKDPSLCHKFI